MIKADEIFFIFCGYVKGMKMNIESANWVKELGSVCFSWVSSFFWLILLMSAWWAKWVGVSNEMGVCRMMYLDGMPDQVGTWWNEWTDSEGGEALLLCWIVRHFCWCENPLRHFCWWGSESCCLIGKNLMSESYVMIGQSWAMCSYWLEIDNWILLEFFNLSRELTLVRTWWDNSSWDF